MELVIRLSLETFGARCGTEKPLDEYLAQGSSPTWQRSETADRWSVPHTGDLGTIPSGEDGESLERGEK